MCRACRPVDLGQRVGNVAGRVTDANGWIVGVRRSHEVNLSYRAEPASASSGYGLQIVKVPAPQRELEINHQQWFALYSPQDVLDRM